MPGKKLTCSTCSKIMRSDNLKRHRKVCRGGKGMHMKIPPRIVTPAQKSKDLRGMHTAVRPVRRLATKDPKWNEIIKKLSLSCISFIFKLYLFLSALHFGQQFFQS